ncbi:hypothetical protein HG536_0C00180 [Torulaspora globosa]|uniref:FAD/NAD(P)-binding domain-containing protein n=1 Tax=Torulaspora globosa TaxID=48254 RepID=A0A7G3ZEB5_9SACH|nr:uncharacterized protein HG536_0C00180 [Torulaspora globosa]QLL31851.1 hypothetical protein HG536_0C00180 [Torulaspora globosa]
MKTEPVIIVVGAGIFGVSLANHLARGKENIKVKLVNPSIYAYFLPSAVRLTVSNDYGSSVIALKKVLDPEVNFIKDRVASFTKKDITLESGPVLPFDALVIATGSRWPDPIGSTSIFEDNFESYFKTQLDRIKEAKHIVFIGGGYINTEITGELIYKYGKEIRSGEKKVSIIHSSDRLLPNDGKYGNSLRDKVTKHLADNGIDIILNSKGSISPDNPNRVILQGSEHDFIDGDVIYEGTGISPNVPHNEIPKLCDERGFIRVRKTFQAEAVEEGCIFAIGDVTNFEYHGLLKRDNWINTITRNVVSYLNGSSSGQLASASTYEGGPVPAAVSLGPEAGHGQFPVPYFGTFSISSFAVVHLKSKELLREKMEPMYAK